MWNIVVRITDEVESDPAMTFEKVQVLDDLCYFGIVNGLLVCNDSGIVRDISAIEWMMKGFLPRWN
jgi:hypothetical protein